MEKIKKITTVLVFLAFFLFNTSFSVYAIEDTIDDLRLSAATPSEALKNENLIQEFLPTFIVAFDPDDGTTTYEDFYKAIVLSDSLVTSMPDPPKREGYLFSGWYSYLDENGKPVLWNFDNDTVHHNITLWAAWEINTESENTDGNHENGNGNSNKFPQKENGGSSTNTNKGKPAPVDATVNEDVTTVLDEPIFVISEETPVPAGNATPDNKLDSMPKTGNLDILRYGFVLSLSLVLLPVSIYRKKER